MGCCTSTAHTQRPTRTLTYIRPRYSENSQTEEVKDPEHYRKPSIDPTVLRLDSIPPANFKNPVVQQQEKSVIETHNEEILKSEVSLEKEKKEEGSVGRQEEIQSSEPIFKEKMIDSSSYKISREQHELLLKFVEERRDAIESDISRLYTHLLCNHREAEELAILMEALKNNNKDVENCVDDLKAYPIMNDRAFYRILERHDNLIKNVLGEYKGLLLKKNSNGYKSFREASLDYIRQYNSSQQDTGVSENTSEPHHSNEETQGGNEVYNKIVEDLQKVREQAGNMLKPGEIYNLKGKYNELGERVVDFQKKLHQQNGLSISEKIDYNSKLKILTEQIQQGKQELDDLGLGQEQPVIYMGLSDILSGTTSMYQSALTGTQSKKMEFGKGSFEPGSGRGSLGPGVKRYDNPNFFVEKKPSTNSRLEIRNGDNGENDLDMIEIEFKN